MTVSGKTTKTRKGGGFKRKRKMEYTVIIALAIAYVTVAGLFKILFEDYKKTVQYSTGIAKQKNK